MSGKQIKPRNNTRNNKSVIGTLIRSVYIIVILTAVTISLLISYFTYSNFKENSNNLAQAHINAKKKEIELEVQNAKEIINHLRRTRLAEYNNDIKSRTEKAYAIVNHLYNTYKDTLTQKQILDIMKESLRKFRFNKNRGFIFLGDMDGNSILYPHNPEGEGKNFYNVKDANGNYVLRDMINIAKKEHKGFYYYTWESPVTGKLTKNITYLKSFKPYNLIISAIDDLGATTKDLQQHILKRIGEIHFAKEGYIFVVDFDGVVRMNRGNPELIGKNILNVKDSNGIAIAKNIITLAQTPGWDGYFTYSWKKFSSDKISPKLAYHDVVKDWRWYFGAGFYLDDVNEAILTQKKKLTSELYTDIFIVIIVTGFVLILIYFAARILTKRIETDLDYLTGHFQTQTQHDIPVPLVKLHFTEFTQLAESTNLMLKNLKEAQDKNIIFERQIQENKKSKTLSQLVGGISHDFNNLLGVILGYAEILEARLSENPKLEKFAHQINIAGKRGANLTRKLLSLTRDNTTDQQACNINTILSEQYDFLKKSLTSMIELSMRYEKDIWSVYLDKNDFEDAILNLCINAMNAMRESQQDSLITIETKNIVINNNENDEYVRLIVTDNGVGIDENLHEKLFEPFFTTRDTGTGLGLSQVKNFVEQSLGTIEVKSSPGQGSSFILTFPRYQSGDAKPETATSSSVENTKGKETILVVDDEKHLREICKEVLTKDGYTILLAEDGIEALAILEKENVNLVISDIIMPNMDGNLLAERIRKLYPDVKIQLVSGYLQDQDKIKANQDLYEDLLNKPVDTAQLKKRVREILDN